MDLFTKNFEEKYAELLTSITAVDFEFRMRKFSQLLDINLQQAEHIIADLSGVEFYKKFFVNEHLIKTLPTVFFTKYKILPLTLDQSTLLVIACWPLNEEQLRWLTISTGYTIEYVLGNSDDISKIINERFGLTTSSVDFLDDVYDNAVSSENEDAIIIKFVNGLIKRCIDERATDIHFEPQRNTLVIRYRVDGNLIIARVPDNLKAFQAAIISRIKIMARLNISEKRLPQDGKILFKYNDTTLDIRVSTLPTIYGESVSLRLLGNSLMPKTLDDILSNEDQKLILKRTLSHPYGIILVTGPTGSGKSTTLSACLREIRDPSKRLISVEDPIEYEISGVNQTQVNSAIGLSFANILRSILRQDPDIIMIGEIRDRETAEIAIRSSITGHLVLSTLHTNDSIGAITRLRDIGVESYLLASAVKLIIAQRLVRKLCPYCAVAEDFSRLLRPEIEQVFETSEFGQARMAVGYERCNNTGFFGRVGVFEFLVINGAIYEAISHSVPESEIRTLASKNRTLFLKSDILKKIRLGITSIEEGLRVIE